MTSISANGATQSIYLQMSGVDIQYSIGTLTTPSSWISISSWPVTITNTNPGSSKRLRVSAIQDLTISSSTGGTSGFFITISEYVTFDGSGNHVLMDTITNYPGLIQNGNAGGPGNANIIVKNFITDASGSSLADDGAWLCQHQFGRNVLANSIIGCTNNGSINASNAGGICGSLTANQGYVDISGCTNTGAIIGSQAGGIAGFLTANGVGASINFTGCANSGNISGSNAGGIAGQGVAYQGGRASFINCSNSGDITADNAGGIAGVSAGQNNGAVTFTDCSNSGIIGGDSSGGISGPFAGYTDGSANFIGCTNTGVINGANAGGITGQGAGKSGGIATFADCTNSGFINAQYAGGIAGSFAGQTGEAVFTNSTNSGGLAIAEVGGIVGPNAGYYNGLVTITGCTNTGEIGNIYSGGIVGPYAANFSGVVNISNCANTGNITSAYAGGIAGYRFALNGNPSSPCSITNSYSTGLIGGGESGGICGAMVGANDNAWTPVVDITNCYSLGAIATTCGGIIGGVNAGFSHDPSINITNCYSYGTLADVGSGIVAVGYLKPTNQTYCYVADGAWTDASANANLSGYPTDIGTNNPGSTWTTLAADTPYILSVYNAELYSPNSASASSSTYTSAAGIFSPGYNYQLIYTDQVGAEITARVFVSKGTAPYYYAYNFNTFTLTTTLSGAYVARMALPPGTSVTINSSTGVLTFILPSPPPPAPSVPILAVGGGGGAFWFGTGGFLFKRKGGGGARRSTKMAPGGNTTCNGPTYIYNKFKPGGSGIGAQGMANRRAKNRLATICGGQNNNCFPCFKTLGQYSNYTHNPNGYVQCPLPQTNVCDLLPTDTPYQICSPWPQFGGLYNNQQRRTPITSSQNGNILWQSSNTSNLVTISTSSPIIARDGTIYMGLIRSDETTGDPVACYFAAFNSNGTARWTTPIINGDINDQSSSAIGPDGTNYFVAGNDVDNMCYLYAITSSGIILWRTPLPSAVNVSASIAIGNNGEIFVCGYNGSAQGVIYAVNTSGGIISGYPIVLINEEYVESVITDGPAISRDGNLYVCTFSAVEGNYGLLYSINIITKEVTWTFRIADQGVPQSRPALSSDQSVVYYTFNSSAGISPNYLIAVNSDGSPKWQYATTTYQSSYDTFPPDSMAIGSDGTIYAVINGYANEINQTSYGKLVAIDPSTGLAKWTYIFGSVSDITASFVDTSPIVGGETIYIGVEIYDVLAISPANPTNIYLTMFAITPAGQLKWKTITTTLNNPGVNDIIYANSPAIGLDGTLYIGATYSEEADLYVGYSKLYAIK